MHKMIPFCFNNQQNNQHLYNDTITSYINKPAREKGYLSIMTEVTSKGSGERVQLHSVMRVLFTNEPRCEKT